MIQLQLKKSAPRALAVLGIFFALTPLVIDSLYANYFFATSLILFFGTWLTANFQQRLELKKNNQWQEKVKVMVAMGLCLSLGLGMLIYYEMQMPKYKVAMIDKELYRVPPQLSKAELKELGRECNTYGNTFCSHAVFAKIVQIDPRDYFALANLAMAQTHLGFHQHAIVNFENAIRNGAKAYDIFKFYGRSLEALGDTRKAVKAYNQSLKLNPDQESLREKIIELDPQ